MSTWGKASHAQSKRQLPKTNEGHPSSRLIDGRVHSSREKLAEFVEEEVNILSIKSMINSDYFALIFGVRKFLFHRFLWDLLRSHWRGF
ncbi:hypothetical protein CEXT_24781 [Caerostris extrusa]|uniref:Uncharacterized protein n=1 Tax=Caerostris extrusa TaxID=172846 RepID=A0AAV4UVF8_CAEEX|nr:hypothetical protein CEXT_24781 [Caerostris extrusa]